MEQLQILIIIIILLIVWHYKQKYDKKNKNLTDVKQEQEELIHKENKKSEPTIIDKIQSIVTRIIPVQKDVLWTYIEPISFNKDVHLHSSTYKVPDFFKLCIYAVKKKHPNVVILTPNNISHYLDDFPIKMDYRSEIPLRNRVDLLFSFILEKYGGLCLSPGTIPLHISELLHQSKLKDIVTCGNSPEEITCSINKITPNTLVIGGKQGSPFLKKYKKQMVQNFVHTNAVQTNSYDILSSLLFKIKPKQFHFTALNDGTHDKHNQKIDISMFLSKTKLNYSNKSLFLISFPYDELLQKKYRWFLELSTPELLSGEYAVIQYLI
jgi:hypothetical protein